MSPSSLADKARALHLHRCPTVDAEAPYADDLGSAYVDGALALEPPVPVRLPAGEPAEPPLRLVPGRPDPAADPHPAMPSQPDGAPLRPAAAQAKPAPFGRVRTPRHALPEPGPHATALVRAILEVVAGDRSVRQLARCASPAVYDELEVMVRPSVHRPWAGTLRRVLLSEPSPGVAEVAAVITRGSRVAALALRLEGVDGRWQLTALQLG